MDREQHRTPRPPRDCTRARLDHSQHWVHPLDVVVWLDLCTAALYVCNNHTTRVPGRDSGVRRGCASACLEGEQEEGAHADRVEGQSSDGRGAST